MLYHSSYTKTYSDSPSPRDKEQAPSPLDREAFPNLQRASSETCDMEIIKELKRNHAEVDPHQTGKSLGKKNNSYNK